ncbi:MAG TPA: hypothetical protein QGH28_04615 [Chloroflexota bacterium]|nr:hypothetical protein [Chloroflexota bacterium]
MMDIDFAAGGAPVLETDAPAKPSKTPSKPKKKEDDELDKRVKRIIREIPDPTPQPGGE